MLSKTGSIALRLLEVQPPNTAATQSLCTSFVARSANTVGSDAPSSVTTSSCLSSTPPSALISSTASSRDRRTVVSLIDIVPDIEFSSPIFTVSPLVSTQDEPPPAVAEGPDAAAVSSTRAPPQAASTVTSPATSSDLVAVRAEDAVMEGPVEAVRGPARKGSPALGSCGLRAAARRAGRGSADRNLGTARFGPGGRA